KLIYSELKRFGGLAILLVTLIIIAYQRETRSFFTLLLPLILSLVWTFGMLGLFGIKLNIMNSVIVIFIFGLVIDYAIFLHDSWKRAVSSDDRHLSVTSGAIIISALTTLCGLGSLLFAKHPALHAIGSTAFIGIVCGFTAVLLIVPMGSKK
ncbi:MAG: MMPL family transporter, partial [Proteobacteria bacterium]|nr:MMPL family transporter [Pseudomonadota bacterium]